MKENDVIKIVLTGPESVGKTTLSKQLAEHFKTTWVPEYAREYCQVHGNENLTDRDFSHIAGGQLLIEDEMAEQANGLLICDTDLITTEVWAHYFLEKCPKWIQEVNGSRPYDLFLLLSPDIPWVGDELRHFEQSRHEFFNKLKNLLEERNMPYEIIAGSFEQRFEQAVRHIEEVVVRGKAELGIGKRLSTAI